MPGCRLVLPTAFFEWQAIEGRKNKQKIRIPRADGDMDECPVPRKLAGDAQRPQLAGC